MSDDWRRESDERYREAVAAVGTPIYGIAPEWQCYRSVGGWGSDPDISLRHRRDGIWVEVITSLRIAQQDFSEANALMRWWSVRHASLERVDFPLEVRIDKWTAEIPVGGTAVEFTVYGDDYTWIADAAVGDRRVQIDGRGIPQPGIALATVDLASYINPGDTL